MPSEAYDQLTSLYTKYLEDEEGKKSLTPIFPKSAELEALKPLMQPPKPPEEEDWTWGEYLDPREKGNLYKQAGYGLWSALDVAAFGVPGALLSRYGGEAGEQFLEDAAPDTSLAKITSGIAGFAGFAAPLPVSPLRVGSKIATKLVGAPAIWKAGHKTVASATKAATKKVTNELGQSAGSDFASGVLGKAAGDWAQVARWDTKVAANWEKFAFKNIDDIKNVTSVIEIDGSDRFIVQNF